ncbi:hypothetical protein FNV43_RR16187 [Rhamnella rubrinervis]|uniref:Fatty acyl-CoA reductase n=1 Tax=Rhamnella rubrinervis TaxID=2594499 RepID=A0A8K0GXM5_9ROSA|nr:hypothetical protein FNV43_RR16187 [Rhamnella rubrinervis]
MKVIGKELFKVLRERRDTNFESFISEKVTAISGDVSLENLGVQDVQLREALWKHIDIVINFAATTRFDERYDAALDTNTLGVLHVLGFAQRCVKLEMLVHVSTAYVCGEREGLIKEDTVFHMGKTLKATSILDFKEEQKLVAEKLKELRDQNASEDTITTTMRDLGLKKAKLYGWSNVYVFTKAMGETCLVDSKEKFPSIIIRPTVITSTYKEPFAGWIEGLRTLDTLVVGYAKGKVKCFLGDTMSILDLIPGDMVIDLMIVAMVAHANDHQSFKTIIYHIGSSLRNPINISNIRKFSFQYFTRKPLKNNKGEPIKNIGKLLFLSNAAVFHTYMLIRFILPLKIQKLGNIISCQYFPDVYTENNRKLKLMMRWIELYKPYTLFKGIFDDENSGKLRETLRGSSKETLEGFNFDPKCIDWEDYVMNIHIRGIERFGARYGKENLMREVVYYAMEKRNLASICFCYALRCEQLHCRESKSKVQEESTIWSPPPEGWIKANIHASRNDEGLPLILVICISWDLPKTLADRLILEQLQAALYDVALSTNTLGALLVLSIAKRCINLKMLVHVSTGWIEGLRTIDSAIASFAKGKMKCFLGNRKQIVDLVNMEIKLSIYTYADSRSLTNKNRKIVKVGKPIALINNMPTLKLYIAIRYKLTLKDPKC